MILCRKDTEGIIQPYRVGVWALVKGEIGHQYTDRTVLHFDRMQQALNPLQSRSHVKSQ